MCTRGTLRSSIAGFSLIELLVSIAISFFLILIVTKAYLDVAESSKFIKASNEMSQAAAAVLDILQRNAALANYSPVKNGERIFTGLGIKGCAANCEGLYVTGSGSVRDFNQIRSASSGSGADSLIFRYVGTTSNSQSQDGQPVNCANIKVASAVLNGSAVSIVENRFFVSGVDVKKLFCIGNTVSGMPATTFSQPALISGDVEDMRVEFGVSFLNGVGNAPRHQINGYMKANQFNSDIDWSSVMSLNLCILVRSSSKMYGSGDAGQSSHLDCNDAQAVSNDGYLRRSYRRTVFLRNAREALPNPRLLSEAKVVDPYIGVNGE